jgi:NitT/TauT family transport system permease protein
MTKYKKRVWKEKIPIILTQIFLLIFFLVIWQILSDNEVINSFLFSSPKKIAEILWQYIATNQILKHIGISLLEVFLGLCIGTTFGILIAIILWWNNFLAKVLSPFLIVFNALPKTALAPIFIIWVGTGVKGITVVAISILLILTILNAYDAFVHVRPQQILMMKSFKATKFQILIKLILPASVDSLINIVEINIGMAWVGIIVGEFIVSKSGIGYLIMYGSQVFKLDLVMMGVFVLAILSFGMYAMEKLLVKLVRRRGK